MTFRFVGKSSRLVVFFFFIASVVATGCSSTRRGTEAEMPMSTHALPPLDSGSAVQLTRNASTTLGLQEHQFIQLPPLNRRYLQARTELARADAPASEPLAQLDAQYETEYRALLTPRQLQALEGLHASMAPDKSFSYFVATFLTPQ